MAGAIPLLAPVVNAVSSYLVDPIARQLKHLFFLRSNVQAMTDTMDELRAKRESTKQDIQIAELEGKTCSPEVALWLQKVDAFDQYKVADIKQTFDQSTNCIAMPSLNIVSNYKLGRRAFKKKKEMVQLLDKAAKFDVVAKRLPPGPARELATPSLVSDENSNLRKICQYLKENTTGIMGIWGMGGVGKTTLLRNINNEFYRAKDGMFDHVIWVEVSQEYSYHKIKSDIATNLGLPSTNANANAVEDFLKRKSFLLLLDDLWCQFNLDHFGVPHPKMHHDQHKHKRMVVFTTRSEKVCGFMEADKKIKVKCLGLDASWLLFKEKANEELIASDELIQHHAKDITKECAGLPLALVTVSKAMSTKTTAQEWECVANMMRKSNYQGIPGMKKESDFFPILKISYDNLESDTLRQCFLYCALWGEDVRIATDHLIECWMGHGLLDDFDDLDEAYNKGGIIIGNLKEACLLESVATPWHGGPYYVKLHDVIRDLALWITSNCGENKQGWLVQPNAYLDRLPEDAIHREVINISLYKRGELDRFPNCHKLKTLILFVPGKVPISTTGCIPRICCLKYLDLGATSIFNLSEEIGGLVGLEYLRLSIFSSSLPMGLGDLKNLKYLYFVNSHMLKIPYGLLARLTKLQVLDLYATDVIIDERYMDDLLSLNELKGVGIRVNSISTLERLRHVPKKLLQLDGGGHESDFTSIRISPSQLGSNSKTSLHELDISDVQNLQELVMTTEGDNSWRLSHLNEITLRALPQLKNVIWKDLETHHFLPRLASLKIEGCNSLTSLCWTAYLPCLETLNVSHCDKLQSIIACDHTTVIEEEGNLFKSLKSLDLSNNPNLECIYEGELLLPSIETIDLIACDKLRKLPLGLDSAKNLKVISVSSSMWLHMNWPHKNHFPHFVSLL